MIIKAIWERPAANPRWGGTFCLTNEGELLYLKQGKEFEGTDKDGNREYLETGRPDWSPAFDDDDRFDLRRAHYFMLHFGGKLVWREKED